MLVSARIFPCKLLRMTQVKSHSLPRAVCTYLGMNKKCHWAASLGRSDKDIKVWLRSNISHSLVESYLIYFFDSLNNQI